MEWAPVSGVLPPLNPSEWERIFALYQQIPEFQVVNQDMDLEEFKTIFWWEYIHRLWGRLIGVAFAGPFLWFLWRRRLRRGLAPHLVVIFVLGGLQGALGWFMVASGFVERSDVSQYRLVAHLAAATLIYAYVLWVAFGLLLPGPAASPDARTRSLRRLMAGFAGLVGLTMASGGFVAGLDAGFIYNTFPLMDGRLVPAGYGALQPWVLNLFENIEAVQFDHRLLASATAAGALGLWLWSRRLALAAPARAVCTLVLAMVGVQFALGVAALLLVVPVWLGALHQGSALVLLAVTLLAVHLLRPAAA
jgi:cytochrome c oxidase assembly protein subunit 15